MPDATEPPEPTSETADAAPFICFSGQDWWYHHRAHSEFQLMTRVALRRKVRLVNSLGMQMPRPGHGTLFLRLVTVPTALPVAQRLRRRSLIYNRSDKHSEYPGVDRARIRELELALLKEADLVLYMNRALQAEEASVVGERHRFLDHGVDLDLFRPTETPEPADLARIPRPRLGFFGGLRSHVVDFTLLAGLARELPHAQIILIGPRSAALPELERLSNVHFLGPREQHEIPRYGAGFDVALMPWQQNEWIRNCNPIKLKEYLALGLNVVTMDFPEAHAYADVLRIASSPDEFFAMVREALADAPNAQRRRASVADASWDGRANELMGWADAAAKRMERARQRAGGH